MGIIGRYTDMLPDAARHRVVNASKWCAHWCVEEDGARNLLGHAEDWSLEPGGIPQCNAPEVFHLRAAVGDELWTDEPLIGWRFERLARRHGLERAVALVCARARRQPSGARNPTWSSNQQG